MIRLSGPADYASLLKIPAVVVTMGEEGNAQTAPATFRRAGNDYEIVIDTSSLRFPQTDTVDLQLDFDSFFTPKKKANRNDDRELVVKGPALVQLFRK
jgi:hypothetical protein